MSKNPFINALAAAVYIVIVASAIFFGPRLAGLVDERDTVLAPIAMISLFTLSAAVMGYLFLYEPLRLYFDGEKTKAVSLFLQTVGVFALITVAMLLILFFVNFS